MPAGDTDKNCMRGEHDDQFDWENTQNWSRILLSKVKKMKRAKSYCDVTAEFASLEKPSLKYKSKDDLSFPCK